MEAYDNARFYKERTNSRLKFMPCKLQSRWIGPYVIANVFSSGVVEIRNLETGKSFKINGHHLKPFIDVSEIGTVEEVNLLDPVST